MKDLKSDLRMSLTHYRGDKNSSNFFKAADDAAHADTCVQNTTIMNNTIPDNLLGNVTNSSKLLLGNTHIKQTSTKPHILFRQYKRAEKRSRRSLVSTLETYTNAMQGGVVQYMPTLNLTNHGGKTRSTKAGNNSALQQLNNKQNISFI